MAKQLDGICISLEAGADLSSYQYYFVEQSTTTDQVTVVNAATDSVLGVLQNKPDSSGREASVLILGHTKVMCGDDSIDEGNLVGPTATGRAQAISAGSDTTIYIAGICTKAADSGEIAEMALLHGPARAQ